MVPHILADRFVTGAREFAMVAGIVLGLAPTVAAQRPDPGPAYATRAMLEQQLRTGASGDQARLIRARLDSGDFRPGDLILLTVDGEKELSDTFTVGITNELELPQIGVVPLHGVLRAELHDRVTQVLMRYLREPVVSVRSLVRVGVEGEVNHPGFYAFAPEMPLMDALTAAGGLTRAAKFEKVRVERQGVVVMMGGPLEDAVRSGRTFDELNLRAGDRVFIPRHRDWYTSVQTLAIFLTIPISLYTIKQIYSN